MTNRAIKFISSGSGQFFSTRNGGDWFSKQLHKRAKAQAAEVKAIVSAHAAFCKVKSRAARTQALMGAPATLSTSGKYNSISGAFLLASAQCYSNWLIRLSDKKNWEQASHQADRAQAMREEYAAEIHATEGERVAEKRAISEQKERAWNALQEAESQSMLALFRICRKETCIQRGWEKMARLSAEAEQLPVSEDKQRKILEIRIQTVAKEIQTATKTIHAAAKEIQTLKAQQKILLEEFEEVQNTEKALELFNTASPSRRHYYGNKKMNAVMQTLQARSMAIFFRYPEFFLAGTIITASAGHTLVGALIGGVLLGLSFAPPILALIIAGLLYLTQRSASKPPRCSRHLFFSADDEYTVAIAAPAPSLMNEKGNYSPKS